VACIARDWKERLHRDTSGDTAREEAVGEMLLRLRWDDSNVMARAKLSQIVGRIWDGLEGIDLEGRPPLSSALWLDVDEVAEQANEGRIEAPLSAGQAVEELGLTSGTGTSAELVSTTVPPGLEDATMFEAVQRTQVGTEELVEATNDDIGDIDAQTARADAARKAMDEGLQAAFDDLDAELRRRMDMFATDSRPGSRMKLPVSVSAKQRKAVHLWAETVGLQHKSFGYRGRRRLHLSVDGVFHNADMAIAADAHWSSEEDSDGGW